MKQNWHIWFEENEGEYVGHMYIVAECVNQIGPKTILADGVQITMDELIDGIEIYKHMNTRLDQTSR